MFADVLDPDFYLLYDVQEKVWDRVMRYKKMWQTQYISAIGKKMPTSHQIELDFSFVFCFVSFGPKHFET